MNYRQVPPDCRRPRFGWWCTLADGHGGPCPAYPYWWNIPGMIQYVRYMR